MWLCACGCGRAMHGSGKATWQPLRVTQRASLHLVQSQLFASLHITPPPSCSIDWRVLLASHHVLPRLPRLQHVSEPSVWLRCADAPPPAARPAARRRRHLCLMPAVAQLACTCTPSALTTLPSSFPPPPPHSRASAAAGRDVVRGGLPAPGGGGSGGGSRKRRGSGGQPGALRGAAPLHGAGLPRWALEGDH